MIVNKMDEIPADEKYLSLASLVDDASSSISALVERELIYKKGSINSFVFKTRAGSELKSELKKQRSIKGDNVNYSKALEDITGHHYIKKI